MIAYNKILMRKRQALGLNIRQMATKADVDASMISRLEGASRGVNMISAIKIARAYEIELEPLILYIASLQGYEE